MSAPALAPPAVPPAPAALARPAWRTAHEQRAAARNTYLAARRQGETLTGAQLATRYGMSERWGRARIAWTALALDVVTSVAANVVGADPTLADPVLVGRLVAAWPPLALFLSLELLMRQLGVRHDGSDR